MPLIPKDWRNLPSTTTPLSAEAIEDLEQRLGAYADSVAGTAGIDPDTFTAKGQTLSSSGAGAPVIAGGAALGQRDLLVGDPTHGSGTRISVKAAPYNVREAGATGNGTTDDTSACQSAINAAASANAPLFVPKGTYINTVLTFPSNTYLYGDGIGSCLKAKNDQPDGASWRNTDFTNGNSNITIRGIEFDGNKVGRPTATASNISSLVGFRGGGSGNPLNPCHRIRIIDCWLHDSHGLGFAFQGCHEVAVTGCHIYNNTRDGCTAGYACQRVVFANNTVWQCGDDHLAAHSGATTDERTFDVAFVGNVCGEDRGYIGYGITMSGILNGVVSGNTVFGGAAGGISVFNNNLCGGEDIVIAGNIIYSAGQNDTVNVSSSGYDNGIRVEVINSGGYGGAGQANIDNVAITGNVIKNPRSHGMRIAGAAGANVSAGSNFLVRDVTIADNVLVGDSSTGYSLADGITIAGNTETIAIGRNVIRGFPRSGVRFSGSNNTHCYMDGLLIQNNGKITSTTAIELGALAGFGIRNCRVFDTASPKTQTHAIGWGTATTGVVSNNDFRGNLTGTTSGSKGANISDFDNINNAGTLTSSNIVTTANGPL